MTPRFTRAMFVYLGSGVGQQRDRAADIALVDEARTARTQLALDLAGLVAEVVPPSGGIGFEPFGGLATRCPLGADHIASPVLQDRRRAAVTSFLAKTP